MFVRICVKQNEWSQNIASKFVAKVTRKENKTVMNRTTSQKTQVYKISVQTHIEILNTI